MAKSPWDPETEELIKKAQMMIDTGAVNGERQKPNTTSVRKKSPRQAAVKKKIRAVKLIGGQIPASPTR